MAIKRVWFSLNGCNFKFFARATVTIPPFKISLIHPCKPPNLSLHTIASVNIVLGCKLDAGQTLAFAQY